MQDREEDQKRIAISQDRTDASRGAEPRRAAPTAGASYPPTMLQTIGADLGAGVLALMDDPHKLRRMEAQDLSEFLSRPTADT